LKPVKIEADDCGCEVRKTSFLQSKLFLGIVTVFAVIMLSFPCFSHIFYSQGKEQIIEVDKAKLQTAEFKISGMTCESCEDHVKHEVIKLTGIVNTTVSYENENAVVQFDSTQTTIEKITEVINLTGYEATDIVIKIK
jgi:copper chaperone CopZ